MATALKILGQLKPAAATPGDLYAVPAATSAVVSSITVCNQSATATTFRVSVSAAGAATDPKDYLYYDVPIAGNDTFVATIGVSLATTDKVRVYSGGGTVSFNAFGQQVT